MTLAIVPSLADEILAILRAQECELRQAGILRLALFGSVARGEAEPDSDVDLLAEFDPAALVDLVRLIGLERRIGKSVGRRVEILVDPVESPRLRANVERDRRVVF